MISTETMIKRINEEIEKLKQKDILVKVKMPVSEENKFSTYSTHELNSVSYQVIYAPKNIVLYEDEYFINFFLNYLINLYTKSDKILYLLENIKEDAYVSLGLVDYNSYFHFTKDKVIINIDTFSEDKEKFKAQFKYSDKLNAKYTVVIGDDELANDTATLKNMKTSEQTTIKLSELVDELKKRL